MTTTYSLDERVCRVRSNEGAEEETRTRHVICSALTEVNVTASCKSLGSCSEKVVYTKHTRLLLFGIQLCASVTLL
jgi:hypothetical protein